MPCYHPLHVFKGKSDDPFKTKIVFKRSESWRAERMDLPCGQCIGCRLERARQWSIRCVHESQMYEKNCFVTLTYSPEKLPLSGSLDVREFQLFMKRLRKSASEKIRFFHCGEYGVVCRNCGNSEPLCKCGLWVPSIGRPHYHALLFGFDFDDKEVYCKKDGYQTYTSSTLSKLWGKGHSLVGDLSFESAGYVS